MATDDEAQLARQRLPLRADWSRHTRAGEMLDAARAGALCALHRGTRLPSCSFDRIAPDAKPGPRKRFAREPGLRGARLNAATQQILEFLTTCRSR